MSVHHARLVALGGVALLAGGAALASMPASAQAAGRNGTTLTATTTLDVSAGVEVMLTDDYGNRSQKLTL